MQNIILPPVLNSVISDENKDFVVKARRMLPVHKSFFPIFFGIIWCSIVFIMAFPSLISIFFLVTENKQYSIIGISFPLIIFSIFMIAGFSVLFSGFYSLFRTGGYFVGTPDRLIYYLNGNFKFINWELFTEEIKVNGNSKKGNVILTKKIWKLDSTTNGIKKYVPEFVYMLKIPNPFEIEKICKKRIKKNNSSSKSPAKL